MGAMVSQITSLMIVYSAVYSGAEQRKHPSFASLAFVRGIHRSPVYSSHRGPITRKMFRFDDVIVGLWITTHIYHIVLWRELDGLNRRRNTLPNCCKTCMCVEYFYFTCCEVIKQMNEKYFPVIISFRNECLGTFRYFTKWIALRYDEHADSHMGVTS